MSSTRFIGIAWAVASLACGDGQSSDDVADGDVPAGTDAVETSSGDSPDATDSGSGDELPIGGDSSSDVNEEMPDGGDSASGELPDTAGTVSVTITSAAGGEVAFGLARLTVPPGALASDTVITAGYGPEALTLPAPETVHGTTYAFGPDGTRFAAADPATLSLPLGATPAVGEVVVISWFDESARTWVDLATTVDDGTASAPVEHFTTFALRVLPPPAVESPCDEPTFPVTTENFGVEAFVLAGDGAGDMQLLWSGGQPNRHHAVSWNGTSWNTPTELATQDVAQGGGSTDVDRSRVAVRRGRAAYRGWDEFPFGGGPGVLRSFDPAVGWSSEVVNVELMTSLSFVMTTDGRALFSKSVSVSENTDVFHDEVSILTYDPNGGFGLTSAAVHFGYQHVIAEAIVLNGDDDGALLVQTGLGLAAIALKDGVPQGAAALLENPGLGRTLRGNVPDTIAKALPNGDVYVLTRNLDGQFSSATFELANSTWSAVVVEPPLNEGPLKLGLGRFALVADGDGVVTLFGLLQETAQMVWSRRVAGAWGELSVVADPTELQVHFELATDPAGTVFALAETPNGSAGRQPRLLRLARSAQAWEILPMPWPATYSLYPGASMTLGPNGEVMAAFQFGTEVGTRIGVMSCR